MIHEHNRPRNVHGAFYKMAQTTYNELQKYIMQTVIIFTWPMNSIAGNMSIFSTVY